MKLKSDAGLITSFIFAILFQKVKLVIFSTPHQNLDSLQRQHHKLSEPLIPLVSLTQKGYIQFLKYVVDVPEVTDYTFCIWVKSSNLTYSHPLLSYSKHEKERLIRVWISRLGTHINLEILGEPIFSIPLRFVEQKWYHICQSWSSQLAAWSFYLNGHLEAHGFTPKLRNIPIKSDGDLVVGQEYTDFDKGLDDGIEGEISGFNFVLASTFPNANIKQQPKPLLPLRNLFKREIRDRNDVIYDPFLVEVEHQQRAIQNGEKPKQSRRQIWDESLEVFLKHKVIPPLPLETTQELFHKPQRIDAFSDYLQKPLGLLLVELSYDCGYSRGAPLSEKGVLVSWTKTNVRVFGGAILKTVAPFCVVK